MGTLDFFTKLTDKKKYVIFTFTVIIIVISCGKKYSEEATDLEPYDYFRFTSVTNLKAIEMPILSKDLSKIIRMQFFNGSLILHDYFDESYLYKLVDLNAQKIHFKFGKKGEGPGESNLPSDLQTIDKYSLGYLNRKSKAFKYIDVSKNFDFKDDKVENSEVTLDDRYFKVLKLKNHFVGTGFFNKRFALSNAKGQLISINEDYPFEDLLLEKNNSQVLSMAYQGDFEFASEEKIAFVIYSSPNIDFIKIIDNKLLVTKSYHLRPPQFTGSQQKNETSAALNLENKFGFISSASNEKYVYVLYSGKTLSKDKYNAFNGSDIIVFDWNGKPIKYFKLNRNISCIGVNDLGTVLYGFADEVKPKLVYFNIPPI
jgi:TolB-like 6-blade propeller-like